ncbi:phosphatidylglycerol lysyltransferase domain-containing protein [Bacillus sp. DJP31]|uniref:phosphatidylglycerol lysyltransferase domain-containing protein n=1 Tax=Bacillus sp. DJP31 TaxID=3409789 RepID=UPI003BB62D07
MATLFIAIFLLLSLLLILYVPIKLKAHSKKVLLHNTCLIELFSFVTNHGGHFLSHLMFLNDKYGYWAVNKSVYFSFQKISGRVIVLGDPIGNKHLFSLALEELQEKCKTHHVKQPIYYQISSKYKYMYEALNYRIIKIGEEAKVSLTGFNLEGKKRGKLRTSLKRFDREGIYFNVVLPPYSEEFLQEIKKVSDVWLGNRSEKGFSVSFFDMEYISRFPIGVLVDPNMQIVAFATLPSYHHEQEKTIHIDLMRYIPTSPNGTMDVLFTSIFMWAKENGYHYCSLGMAPLANVGSDGNPKSLYEWSARLMYLYGEKFYKFKGLKKYKEKFATDWEPRYIAYKKTTLIGVLFRIIILIHLRSENLGKFGLNLLKKAS